MKSSTRNTKQKAWIKRWSPGAAAGDRMFRNIPFLIFLGGLLLGMVYNVHRAQRTLRAIEAARSELQDLRWHASAIQSEIMYDNKQSEVLKRMRAHGLGVGGSSPRRLVAVE